MSMIDSSTRGSDKPSSISSENAKEKDVGVQLHTLEATEDLDPSFETRTMLVQSLRRKHYDWFVTVGAMSTGVSFLSLLWSILSPW